MINKGLSKVAIFFLYLISLLPLRILYLLSDFLFVVLYHIIKYRRVIVAENLKNSFPEKSNTELLEIEKTYFSYLADLMVETIKMLSVSPKFLQKRYSFTNKKLVDDYENQNKSYLIAVGHYGNWEWNTVVTPLTLKAQPLIIYKPLNNELFDEVFKTAREKGGSLMIRMKTSLREIVRRKNELTVTVFASDQTPAHGDAQDWIQFLNQPTSVFIGLEKIAKSTNYPKNFSLLKDRIKAEPAFWLWSHRRWKYKPQNAHE